MVETLINNQLDSSILIEAIRVTEAAAIAVYPMIGRGDEMEADQRAVNAMRATLAQMNIDGTIVIGEVVSLAAQDDGRQEEQHVSYR